MKVGDLVSINSQKQVFRPRAYHGVLVDGSTRNRAHGHPDQAPSQMDSWVEGAHWEPIAGTGVVVRISSNDIVECRMVDSNETYAIKAGGVKVISKGAGK